MTDETKPTIGLRGVPTWMILAVCAVLVAIGVFIYQSGKQDRDDDQAIAKPVFEAPTIASLNALKKCLAGDGGGAALLPNADAAWKDTASGNRGYSPSRHLFVDLIPASEGFTVHVLTRNGEALTAEDRKLLKDCLGDS